MEIRVQKLLAQANVASRRGAETLIEQGRVRINGQPAKLGDKADPENDVIEVDGERLRFDTQRLIYLALNKPKNVLTTSEPHYSDDRRTVLDLVPNMGHLFTIGRLDADSEGLTILTNDGSLTQKLTHPSNRHSKEYRVTVYGLPSEDVLEQWQRGIFLAEDGRTAPCFVEIVHGARDQSVLRVIMIEGKKRQIRRVASALGHPVVKLVRTHIGAFSIEGIKTGEYREMTPEEVAQLSFRAPETRGLHLRRLPKADDDYTPRPERPRPEGETTDRPRPERAPNDLPRTRRGTDQMDDKIDAQMARAARGEDRPRRDYSDRPPRREGGDRPWSDRPPRREGEGRPARPWSDRPPRREGEGRPSRPYSDRPRREGEGRPYSDRPPRREGEGRPARPYSDRPPRRGGGDRPARPFNDRPPRREGGDRPARPFNDRPRREGGDRPARPYSDRPPRREGEGRPSRPYSDRPPRREGEGRPARPYSDRPPRREGGDRPARPYSDRPPRREGEGRPARPFNDRPRREGGDRPARPYSDRPPRREGEGRSPRREGGDRPARPYSDRSPRREGGDRPARPFSGRPRREGGDRPARPFNDRPRREGSDRPASDQPPAPRKRKDEDGDA